MELYNDLEVCASSFEAVEYKSKYEQCVSKVSSLESRVKMLTERNELLMQQNDVLERNISCLFKTAKLELDRKVAEIARLREITTLPCSSENHRSRRDNSKHHKNKSGTSNVVYSRRDSRRNTLTETNRNIDMDGRENASSKHRSRLRRDDDENTDKRQRNMQNRTDIDSNECIDHRRNCRHRSRSIDRSERDGESYQQHYHYRDRDSRRRRR